MLILQNKNKLKGKEIYIENDLTKQEREIQAAIRQKAKEERNKGNEVKIGYLKLRINGKWEHWNDFLIPETREENNAQLLTAKKAGGKTWNKMPRNQ